MPAMGLHGEPLEVSGTVRRITDGQFTLLDVIDNLIS